MNQGKTPHDVPGAAALADWDGRRRGVHLRLTVLLDQFLSEHLRQEPPHALHRHRVLIGSTLFALVFTLSYLLIAPASDGTLPALLQCVYYCLTLLLARRARSLTFLTALLCLSMAVAYVVSIFLSRHPSGGVHATSMLIPSFVVFMVGPRLGFMITLLLAVSLGLVHPIYRLHFTTMSDAMTREEFLAMYLSAAAALMGSWFLSALHSTSRDSAHDALEQALRTLRESENKLSSLVESTDDLVFSLDTQLCFVTANAAMRQRYQQVWKESLALGQPIRLVSQGTSPERWTDAFAEALAGRRVRFEEEYKLESLHLVLDVSISPLRGEDGTVTGMTVFARDATARKQAETRLREMHRGLVEVSRYAGMAEVATGVLHNVGNTLTSVNTSVGLLDGQLRRSRVPGLRKAATLLSDHASDLATFLSGDVRGRQLPAYLFALSEELEREQGTLRQEVGALAGNLEHIKSIVSMQQQHARVSGVLERLPVPQLIEEALRLHAVSFERQGIRIEREFAGVPPILVDRHNLLQILVNLLSNARDSLLERNTEDRWLCIRVSRDAEVNQLFIEVIDNGMGIPPEHLVRIFSQGFTTKKHGHGFGLHISALTAADMHGRLSCTSAGPGRGATFTLVLPVDGPEVPGIPGALGPPSPEPSA